MTARHTIGLIAAIAACSAAEFFIVQRVDEHMPGDYLPAVVRGVPAGVRAVYATWELEAEVNNGGVDQYSLNTEGALADEAIAGFRLFQE